MVVRVWLLILVLVPGVLCAGAKPPSRNHCLECHPVHYRERATCFGCHRGIADTLRIDIAHSGLIAARFAAFTIDGSPVVQRGEQRLKDYACRRCHTSDGKGNRLASNLDLVEQYSTPEELSDSIKSPVLFMPEFHFSEVQRVELVNALLAGARRTEPPGGELPGVIHFEGESSVDELQFEKHCGSCHRVLTSVFGGLGHGLVGPNLSGLFTEFYLKNFTEEGLAWNTENLDKWLKNPRKVRPLSQMAPVQLKTDEFESLCRELGPGKVPGSSSTVLSAQAGTASAEQERLPNQ